MSDAPACHQAHPDRSCSRTAPGGYCPPKVCWCGSCPWWRPQSYTPVGETSLDVAARKSGKRASGAQRKRAHAAA